MMFGWRKRAKKGTSEGSSIIGTRTIEQRSGKFSGTLFVEYRRKCHRESLESER